MVKKSTTSKKTVSKPTRRTYAFLAISLLGLAVAIYLMTKGSLYLGSEARKRAKEKGSGGRKVVKLCNEENDTAAACRGKALAVSCLTYPDKSKGTCSKVKGTAVETDTKAKIDYYTCACLPPKDSCENLTSGYCFSGSNCGEEGAGAVVNGGGGCGDKQVCCAGSGCYNKAQYSRCETKKGNRGTCINDRNNVLKCIKGGCGGFARGDDCTMSGTVNTRGICADLRNGRLTCVKPGEEPGGDQEPGGVEPTDVVDEIPEGDDAAR